jgi:hypothetical protein
MVRFLGGETIEETTAAYITASDPRVVQYEPRPVGRLYEYLDRGYDIGRSLWDRGTLLAHFDIDYVNFTFPGEAHVHATRTFDVLRPVVRSACDLLGLQGIRPLQLLSGCGYHLVWSVRQNTVSFDRLAALGRLSSSLEGRYRKSHSPPGRSVPLELGRAHAGLGLLLEYLSHRILSSAAASCEVPVEVTAVRVGAGERGSEAVSLDISEYADPLHRRTVRVPFSVYFKPQQRRDVLGEDVVSQLPPLFLIPLGDMDVGEGLRVRQSPQRVTAWAAQTDARIPDSSVATEALIDAYLASDLARFHELFYSHEPEPPERWPDTYDATPLDPLPPCGRKVLEDPCDALMQPGRIRHIVRLLLGDGWHPRDIAGLIRSKYERDHGWGRYWFHYDATSRAEFYTRLFSGLFFVGRDDLIDFNCRSAQEKGYCTPEECSGGLERSREALLGRRSAHV